MAVTVWSLVRVLSGREAGRLCRCCGEPIVRDDRFGMGEGVCTPCRRESDR